MLRRVLLKMTGGHASYVPVANDAETTAMKHRQLGPDRGSRLGHDQPCVHTSGLTALRAA